jgi:hypothetical protein
MVSVECSRCSPLVAVDVDQPTTVMGIQVPVDTPAILMAGYRHRRPSSQLRTPQHAAPTSPTASVCVQNTSIAIVRTKCSSPVDNMFPGIGRSLVSSFFHLI